MSGSSPGWMAGYVPSAAEWNGLWAGKADLPGVFVTLSATGTVSGAGFVAWAASPPPIGSVAPAAGTFTALTATGPVVLADATIAPSASDATLDLNFISGAPLDSRITFTRASVGTYVDAAGTMRTALTNIPRFDFNPVTYAPRGLLIEEARTNLLLWSGDPSNAAWNKSNVSIASNATAAPDGTVTAARLVENSSTAAHGVNQLFTKAASALTYTLSVYLKAATRSLVRVMLEGSTSGTAFADFSLLTGAIFSGPSVTGTWAAPTATIIPAGNGWFRCTVTATSNTDTGVFSDIYMLIPTASYLGDGTSGLYVWGAALEQATFPTSYIPTTTVAVTRAVDVATMPASTTWFSLAAGSLVADADINAQHPTLPQYLAQFDDGTAANRVFLRMASASSVLNYQLISGSASQTNTNVAAVAPYGTLFRVGATWTAGAQTSAFNGIAATATTGALSPAAITQLRIGNELTGVGPTNGHLRRLRFWSRVLTNAELQAATGTESAITNTAIDGSPIGGRVPAPGSFTSLAVSGVASGAGLIAWAASPPAIGVTTPAAGAFTSLTTTSTIILPNNITLQSKDSTGTAQPLIWINPSNITMVRPGSAAGSIQLQNFAGTAMLTINSGTNAIVSSVNFSSAGGMDSTIIGATTPAAGTLTSLNVTGAAGTSRNFSLLTSGSIRWLTNASATAEGGANAGSDYGISRYSDAGAYIDTPFTIVRSSGTITLTGPVGGAGIIAYLASPPAIGGTAPAAGAFTTLRATTSVVAGPAATNSEAGNIIGIASAASAGQTVSRYNGGGASGAGFFSQLTNATTYGPHLAVANTNVIGSWQARADDGTSFGISAAGIYMLVDGTVSTNIIPGKVSIRTSDATGAAVEGLYVDSSQRVVVAKSIGLGAAGPTWTAGAGVPATTQPKGSLFSRTDGAAGSTLYVTQGGGVWAAVASV